MACSVRQAAIDRIFGKAQCWRKLKSKNEKLKIVLSGCVLEADKPKMEKIFDIIFDIKHLKELPQMLDRLTVGGKQITKKQVEDYFSIHPKYESNFQAFMPVMTGCNNFCTYCAVPYTKGREKSRSAKDIIKEVKELIQKGYKEITLLGQNVNSYGVQTKNQKYKTQKSKFADLLRKINQIPGKFWVRFLTSNPQDMSDELIRTVKECKKVCEYVHLPVQAGNNRVLKNMNRKYTRKHYFKLIEKIRKEIFISLTGGPGVAISTDTIVGFSGETKEQFRDTLDLYKKVDFDMAYIAQYSPRPGTVAAKMKDDVPKQEKKRREKELTKILEKTALKNNKKYLNKIVDILIEKESKDYLFGRTRTFKLVQFKGPKSLIGKPSTLGKVLGKFVKVKITSVTPWAMKGKIAK